MAQPFLYYRRYTYERERAMGIDYRFGEWRNTGEPCDKWSPMAYRLLSKCERSPVASGYRIGQVLWLHHCKGLSPKEISQASSGYEKNINSIKGIIRGFGKDAGAEAKEAYSIGMYMVECEPEILGRMYEVKVTKMEV